MGLFLFFTGTVRAKSKLKPVDIQGQWVVLAGLESIGPSAGRDSWDWVKATGGDIVISPRSARFPFENKAYKDPVFHEKTVSAKDFYRDQRTPFEALGIPGNRAENIEVCTQDGSRTDTVIPVGHGLIVVPVTDGGYVLAVNAKKGVSHGRANRSDCRGLAGKAAKVVFSGWKLQRAGCWSAGAYTVYAVTYSKGKKLPHTVILYKRHGERKIHRFSVRNSLTNMYACDGLPAQSKIRAKSGLTSTFSWVKDLDCTSSFLHDTGILHASAVWLDSPKYRVCGFSWKYQGHRGFMKVILAR